MTTNSYRVVWEIDMEADTPAEAARKALAAIKRRGSIAHIFTVTDREQAAHSRERLRKYLRRYIYHPDVVDLNVLDVLDGERVG